MGVTRLKIRFYFFSKYCKMIVQTRYMDKIVIKPLIPAAFISHSWHVTPWTDCSRSCGRGLQTRKVICRMKISANDYGTSTNCSADTKPNISLKTKYCNSIACDSDWDTEEGFIVSNSVIMSIFLFLSFDFLCPFLWVTASVPLQSIHSVFACGGSVAEWFIASYIYT